MEQEYTSFIKKMECACYTMEIRFSAYQELGGGDSLSENFLEFFSVGVDCPGDSTGF